MNEEDKKLIADYMGWNYLPVADNVYRGITIRINFDSNDSRLCVEKMVEKGDWKFDFKLYCITVWEKEVTSSSHTFESWLFNPDNFFTAMAAWLKEE